MDTDGSQHYGHHDERQPTQHQSRSSTLSPLRLQPSQSIKENAPGSGTPRASPFVFRPFSASLNRPQGVPSILAGRSSASFASSLPQGPPAPSNFMSPYTPPPGPSPLTPTTPITSTSRDLSRVTINDSKDESSATPLRSRAISSSVQKSATKIKVGQANSSGTAHDQQTSYIHTDPHDANSEEQLDPFEEDKRTRDTTLHVTDHHHDGSHIPSPSAATEPSMNTFVVARPEQEIHGSANTLQLEPKMKEQESSAYYACLTQCIDGVTKPYRDTISRQNQKLSEAESNLLHERARLRMVEDVGLVLKDQNETILGKNVQLEKEVSQLQMHKSIMESRLRELSEEITHLQDMSSGLKDSTVEKVGSLKASCLEADGDLEKLREHLMQYGVDIQDYRMSLEQWQSERDQALDITCRLKRKQVHAMADLQQKYDSAANELEILRQRSEAYASTNDQLQQMMQQLASDHQSQMFEMAKTTESLENEAKLLNIAKDHQHGEFESQIASVEALLHESLSSLDQTKKDLDRTKLDLTNAEAIIQTREESIRNLEEQVKTPETRTAGVSTEDDASFDLCISYRALQGQNHAQQGQIDALQVQNRTFQGQNKAFKGENRALLGQNHELVSLADDLRGKISILKGQIQKLADERSIQNEKIEALEQARLTHEHTSAMAEKLQSEIQSLKSKLEASVAESLKQQDNAKELTAQLAESECKTSELMAEIKSSQSKQLQNTVQSQKGLLEARAKEVEQLNQSIRDIDKAGADFEAWKQDQMAKNQDNQSEIQRLKTALEDAQCRLTLQATTSIGGATSPLPLTDIARAQGRAASWTDFLKWPTDVESSSVSSNATLLQKPSIGVTGQNTEPAPNLEHHIKGKASSATKTKTSSTTNKEASADKENTPPPQEAASTPISVTRAQSSTTTKGSNAKAKGKVKGKGKTVAAKAVNANNNDEDDDDDDFEQPPPDQPRKYVKSQVGAVARRVLVTDSDTVTGTTSSESTLSSPDASMSNLGVGNARKRPSRRANK
ncbi:hypothetical protein BGZ82_009555 [Podila clonocystis]|nr:hypothetical protein BGZ82_009555 [Podila clonocystis]